MPGDSSRRAPARERCCWVGQCRTACSAPAPVKARTSSSLNRAAVSGSWEVMVPSQPKKKPSGIEMMPGLLNGNYDQSWPVNSAVSEPDTTGEKTTRPTLAIRPP